MPPPLRRAARLLLVVLALATPAPLSTPARASEGLEVLVHLRGPDGREETRRVSRFKFVFYDRRYIRRSGGIGGSPSLKVKDLPREVSWIQNDALQPALVSTRDHRFFRAVERECDVSRLGYGNHVLDQPGGQFA